MRLNLKEVSGEEWFECERCRIQGERKAFVLGEEGGCFCLSCWLEKEHTRFNKPAFSKVP